MFDFYLTLLQLINLLINLLQFFVICCPEIFTACHVSNLGQYIFIYLNRQDMRPEVFPRENFLTACIGLLYRQDTPTGVCPSLHVAYSMGIASAWLKEKNVGKWFKAFILVSVALICLATMFIKQHSAVDFFVALPVCLLAEEIAYGKSYWAVRRKKRHSVT